MTPPTYSIYWDLPVLVVVVSLVYSATRYDGWYGIVSEAARWGGRMTLFLGGIGLVLYLLGWWVDSGAAPWVLALGGGVAAILFIAAYVVPKARRSSASAGRSWATPLTISAGKLSSNTPASRCSCSAGDGGCFSPTMPGSR